MDLHSAGKTPNTSLSFRYNANNEEIEELSNICDDDPPTPRCEISQSEAPIESSSPKKLDKSSSLIDKYFKSMRSDKVIEKHDDTKNDSKSIEDSKTPQKEVTLSPMKEYLHRLGKKNPEPNVDSKEGSNETWKIFHDFKYKIAQAVEDMKSKSVEDNKEKTIPRENSVSDSEESSAVKDCDQQSVGDTDNQVSSLDSSVQNLSEVTQPLTARAAEIESSLNIENKNSSESSDDTHKNFGRSESRDGLRDFIEDSSMMDVESGVEALEDTNIEGLGETLTPETPDGRNSPKENYVLRPPPIVPSSFNFPPPNKNNNLKEEPLKSKSPVLLTLPMYLLTIILVLSYILYPNCNIWNGFLLGMWFYCFASNLKKWLLENYFSDCDSDKRNHFRLKRDSVIPSTYTIPSVKEYRPVKKYEGWINHYRVPDYDPYTYHINQTTTAFIKLEGCNLRVSYTTTKIPKRQLWDEKIENVTFYQHRFYNLTGARIVLLPKGLVKKRQWSKKYPICIVLNEKEKIQVLEKENASLEKKTTTEDKKGKESQTHHEIETETTASPEKKKKFIWKRREKSIPPGDIETGKEGLRHRIVKKIHRDKKIDSISTLTEPLEEPNQSDKPSQPEECLDDVEVLTNYSATNTKDDIDEEFDENDLTQIKELLDEAETEGGADGSVDGEWSVHVRHSTDKHSHLYLFARTGRDKHEWYRRFCQVISEANAASLDSPTSEEKSTSDPTSDNKDGIELAVYKVSDKDSVAFGKNLNKPLDTVSEGKENNVSSPVYEMPTLESYEKTFWPYLFKIIQSKSPSPECNCRTIPAEVTWLNTVVARVMYDVMRDPHIIARVRARIQRKLHTLKLPSFMSPLVVTELSLAGACPLVERVSPPSWDERGVWLDAELRYDGGAYITVLTQINLMKLKEKNLTLEDQLLAESDDLVDSDSSVAINTEKQLRKRKPAIFDSDVEDSAESSSDDETPPVQPVDSAEKVSKSDAQGSPTNTGGEGGSSKKKFLRMVDRIATNKYFQQVTDYKYVKRAMEGLSNTDIKLQIEVQGLEGRLAFNLPPPPHDRFWIGFRTNPQLVLKARPAFGARTLRFTHITNWIEQKLSKEFEKVLVLPNMEDFLLSVMTPTPVEFE